MRTYPLISRTVLLLSLFLMAPLSAQTVHASDPDILQGPTAFAPVSELNVVAAGAVEDTLKACLARIPADASAGQRLLAEQSCEGAEGTRNVIEIAPKF